MISFRPALLERASRAHHSHIFAPDEGRQHAQVWMDFEEIRKQRETTKDILVHQLLRIKLRSDEIVDEQDKPVPLTEDFLKHWEVFNLEAAMQTVMAESLPKAKASN